MRSSQAAGLTLCGSFGFGNAGDEAVPLAFRDLLDDAGLHDVGIDSLTRFDEPALPNIVGLGETYEAANGQEGLEKLGRHWIDLVLVDINMPVMNGEEMIAKVRENPTWSDLPIIVVSTEGSPPA